MQIENIPNHIIELIKKGEGIDIEFKTSLAKLNKDTFESICAFLNTTGGHLFLGITNESKIEGVIKDCAQEIKNNIVTNANNQQKLSPTYYLNPKVYKTNEGSYIIYVFVPEGSQVHHTTGKIFIRNEDGDFNITNEHDQVSQLYLRKKSTYSENTIYSHLSIDDLREDLLQRVRVLAENQRPDHPWLEMTKEELLKSAGLYRKDYQTGKEGYTLAAALLLGKDTVIHNILSDYKTDALIRVVDVDRFDDRDIIKTNLIESYDRLMAFIKKHIPDKFFQENDHRISLRFA